MRRINSLLGAAFHGAAAPRGFTTIFLCILVVIGGAIITSEVFSKSPGLGINLFEKDKKAPVDYGYGPGAGIGPARPNLVLGQTPAIPKSTRLAPQALPGAAPKAAAPAGRLPPSVGTLGIFGPPFPWPIIPLHMGLLPDGRVLSYGTDQTGAQGAQLIYDVWDPRVGYGPSAHSILPNGTSTDIFCSAASLIGEGLAGPTSLTSDVLITGGDLTVNGVRNYSNNKVNVFNPGNNTLTASGTMNYPRWYPSITTLRNGDKLVLGGRPSPSDVGNLGEPTPEVFNPGSGWRALPGIAITDGTPGTLEWYYPRSFVGFDGAAILLENSGKIFRLTTGGMGTMQDTGSLMAPGVFYYPSVMFFPFKVLMVRAGQRAQVVDLSGSPPVVTDVPNLNYDRIWGNATQLPDGEILVTGGSGVNNELINVAYQAEIFNPYAGPSGTWNLVASAAIPRLYHSSALLLPDGTVLTGGGGAPGPVNELNVEIYYPYYLWAKDGSGNAAPRPTIVSAPSRLILGQNFSMTVGSNDQIIFVDLVRVGASTHSFDPEQRLIPVAFSQNGTTITGSLNLYPEEIPPGYYMLFVWNANFVPAVAKIVSIPQAVQNAVR
ncbi:MAG TPA: galactose oxidase-like domain-containing protein [Methylocella sp.]|nr:galactose oxidase-like domain-containing protein [Methylocella sp.]